MSGRWRRGLQCAAVCLIVAAYAGLCHYSYALGGSRDLGAALCVAPLTLVALVFGWRAPSVPVALGVTAGLAVLLTILWPFITRNFSLCYLVQEGGVYCLLGATFARTLLPHHVPICTRLADKVHGPLSALEVTYTRYVTAAWSVFFFSVAAMSMLLYVTAPIRVWSIYINFCVIPLNGLMFIGEYWVRRRILPGEPRAGILDAVRVYFASSH